MTSSCVKKGGLLVLLVISSMVFSSCRLTDYFTKQSGNEYRNAITAKMNEFTPLIENSLTAYDQAIPDLVTEESTITTDGMIAADKDLQSIIAAMPLLLEEESYDTELQNTIRDFLQKELEAVSVYEKTYSAMVAFYKDGTYKTNLADVTVQDNQTEDAYNAVVTAHNATVDALELKKEPS